MSELAMAPRRPNFRLYVDEVGHVVLNKTKIEENERYLGLIGVACELKYIEATIKPDMEGLKDRYFRRHQSPDGFSDPDELRPPIIFHRREMAQRLYPFGVLKDRDVNDHFDADLLALLTKWEYSVFSVVVDQIAVQESRQQDAAAFHTYHYALEHLLDGYVHWLEQKNSIGDVIAEARGGKEDRSLSGHYSGLYTTGTKLRTPEQIANRLTSKELKLKKKHENLAGLQLVEIIAQPCHKAVIASQQGVPLKQNFNDKIVVVLESGKYYVCEQTGILDGFGRKWLP